MNAVSCDHSHFQIYNDAASFCFSLQELAHRDREREPCLGPWGTPCQLAYVSVVYFNSCGYLDVCTSPSTRFSNVRLRAFKWVRLRVQKTPVTADHPDLLLSLSLRGRRLGKCQGYLPLKIGQIIGCLRLQCPSCDRECSHTQVHERNNTDVHR